MDASALKNIFRLLVLVVVIVLAGCSDDELSSPLVGDWEGISFITSAPVDENGDGTAHTDLNEEMDCVSMEASFHASGNFSITSYEATYDIDIVDGEVILTPKGCSSIDENGHWTLDDSNTALYLEFNVPGKDDPTLIEIEIELSDQRLLMKNLFFSENGEEVITYTVEFRRS